GIPQAHNFLNGKPDTLPATVSFQKQAEGVLIDVKTEFMPDSVEESPVRGPYSLPVNSNTPDYLYYHVANPEGYLDRYYVIEVQDDQEVALVKNEFLRPGSVIRVYYKGYLGQFTY